MKEMFDLCFCGGLWCFRPLFCVCFVVAVVVVVVVVFARWRVCVCNVL